MTITYTTYIANTTAKRPASNPVDGAMNRSAPLDWEAVAAAELTATDALFPE
jgi:hypothetical protein